MNDDNVQFVSKDTYDNLKTELQDLKKNKLPEIAERIDEARQMGDLSENAEYHSARDEMRWAKTRVQEITKIIDNAKIISDQPSSNTHVTIGSTVLVEVNGNNKEYSIVGPQEADPFEGKISNESPLGMAFLGKSVNDHVEVKIPAGIQIYIIKKIK